MMIYTESYCRFFEKDCRKSKSSHIPAIQCDKQIIGFFFRHFMPDLICIFHELQCIRKLFQINIDLFFRKILSDIVIQSHAGTSTVPIRADMRAAAALMEKGIDFTKIITETFDEKTYAQNQVLGRALLESFLFMDGRCIVSYVTKEEMDFYQVKAKHLDGIVSQLKLTKGIDVAIFMYELEHGTFKVSLRSSEKIDVSVVASYFGGGGHARAAGFSMTATPHDIINNLARRLELQFNSGSEAE